MAKDKKTPSIASQGAVLRRVLQYIGPHVSLVVLSLALCLISVALTLYVPILVGRAVDCIVGPNAVDFAALTPILMTIAICIVIAAAAQWVMNMLHNRITYNTVRDIRRDAFAHIQNLPLSYLDAHPTRRHGQPHDRRRGHVCRRPADGLHPALYGRDDDSGHAGLHAVR